MYERKVVPLLDNYLSGEIINYKKILHIFLPILMDQALLVIVSMVSIALISSVGAAAVSAVSMVDALNIFIIYIFIAVGTGGTVIISQYFGKGNGKMAEKTATQLISMIAVISAVFSLIMIVFHQPILTALFGSAEADVFRYATLYFIGSCISYPFVAIFHAVCATLLGVGETKPNLLLSFAMNATNILMNVILLKVFHMGIMGLAVSVILARVLGMLSALYYVRKHNKTVPFRLQNALKWDVSLLKKMILIALPFVLEQIFFNGGKLFTQSIIVQMGTVSLAVNAIVTSITTLHQVGPNALNIATVSITGQCVGQRNILDARKFVQSFIGIATVIFIGVSFVIFPLFPVLMDIFHATKEATGTIYHIVLISAIASPVFWSLSFILPSALSAAGDAKYTSLISALTMWLFRVAVGYLLGITLGFGVTGVWVAVFLEWGVRSFIYLMRFKGNKWHQHQLI